MQGVGRVDVLLYFKCSTTKRVRCPVNAYAISVITRAEILAGLSNEEIAFATPLLDQYQLFIIDKPIADLAAKLRRETGWKLPDAFQAALAQYHKTLLTTRNTKDFDPNKHRFVEVPYKI